MKFSIITAVKNAEKTIEQTLSSLFCQKDCNFQLVVIDGRSTDSTLKILDSYADQIDILISEPDSGIYDAFNKGIKHADGDIIYFLNADDFLYDDTVLEKVSDTFIQSEADVVYGNLNLCNTNGQTERVIGKKLTAADTAQGKVPSHTGVFVRRSVFNKTGLFDLKYKVSSDYDFLLKCFLNSKLKTYYTDQIISNFRQGGVSNSYRHSLQMKTEHDIIATLHLGKTYNSAEEIISNSARFRVWLETLLLNETGITVALREKGIEKAAIFGTKTVARYLMQDCRKSGIKVMAFVDNDKWMVGKAIEDLPVLNARDKNSYDGVNAVITSVESSYDATIKDTIRSLTQNSILVLSWKELVDETEK